MVKNKVAPPFRTAEFDVLYGQGISRTGELVDIAVQLDIVQKSGSWFSYDGQRIGQGRDKVKDFLTANTDVAGQIEAKVRENVDKLFAKSGPKTKPVAAPVAQPAAPAEEGPARRVVDESVIDIEVDDDE